MYENHIIIDETIFNDFHQCPFSRVHRCHNAAFIHVDDLEKGTKKEQFGKKKRFLAQL